MRWRFVLLIVLKSIHILGKISLAERLRSDKFMICEDGGPASVVGDGETLLGPLILPHRDCAMLHKSMQQSPRPKNYSTKATDLSQIATHTLQQTPSRTTSRTTSRSRDRKHVTPRRSIAARSLLQRCRKSQIHNQQPHQEHPSLHDKPRSRTPRPALTISHP
jgi:hypothetical protein